MYQEYTKQEMEHNTILYEKTTEAREEGAKQNSLEIAKNLKNMGMPLDKIASSCNLSKKEVEKL